MKGKSALMAGVAAVALVASMQAGYAAKKTSDATSAPAAAVVPAGPTTSELAARIQALEDALQADEAKAKDPSTAAQLARRAEVLARDLVNSLQ